MWGNSHFLMPEARMNHLMVPPWPEGTNRLARVNAEGQRDPTFQVHTDGRVDTILVEASGEYLLLGGNFTLVNGIPRRGFARLNADGALDQSFDAALDGPVERSALAPDGRILIVGGFSTVHGVPRPMIARLHADGAVDATFDAGPSPVDQAIRTVAVESDGAVLIGGWFRIVQGVEQPRLARLDAQGLLDPTLAASLALNSTVSQIVLQPDGRILMLGYFPDLGGQAGTVARILPDGEPDPGFTLSSPPGSSTSLAVQPDGKILVHGSTRLLSDGTIDPCFFVGAGAGDPGVAASFVQPDGSIVIAGAFQGVNGLPRPGLARLHGGDPTGPGWFEFSGDL
jgi:uncharacterized delta-60 repeat protein